MPQVKDILNFLDSVTEPKSYQDYDAAFNGLQFGDASSSKKAKLVCCAVDAGSYQFEQAKKLGADILIVHHGMLWGGAEPLTGAYYKKLKTRFEGKICLYSSHLPLDGHPLYGNNAQIVKALKLESLGTCFEYYGRDIGQIAACPKGGRAELARRLRKLFKASFKAIEFGSANPKKIAICSGSAAEGLYKLADYGVDTFMTGEVKEHHFEAARDLKVNLYPCGHYATECFGVQALAKAAAEKFKIDWKFISVDNPL